MNKLINTQRILQVCVFFLMLVYSSVGWSDMKPLKVVFDGVISEHKWALKELDPNLPSDWSDYEYLVIEIRASTPQRFFLWIYTADGPRRLIPGRARHREG